MILAYPEVVKRPCKHGFDGVARLSIIILDATASNLNVPPECNIFNLFVLAKQAGPCQRALEVWESGPVDRNNMEQLIHCQQMSTVEKTV